MPNWCFTDITIYHKDEKKVKVLYDKIQEWTSKDYCENGFGHNWLGNIVGNSGICDPLNKDAPRCRGTLEDVSVPILDNNHITMHTETAWSPHMKMWQMLIDKYLPDAEIYYTAEETGCGLYWSNDPDVVGKYNVDIFEPPSGYKFESKGDADEKYVIEFLQDVFNTKETDINELLAMANDMEESWFCINQYQFVDINDCE